MNDEHLQEIEDRLTDATPGPWEYDENRHTHDCPVYTKGAIEQYDYIGPKWGGVVGSSEWIWLERTDGEFIAAAPTDIRDLIDEVRRLRAEIRIDGNPRPEASG